MDFAELQKWLVTNPGFLRLVDHVKARHVAAQFDNLQARVDDSPDWSYLMLCASILAPRSQGDGQDVSLRLAHACLEDSSSSDEQRASALAVLHSLLNQPSMSLAFRRDLVAADLEERLPLSIRLDWVRRRSEGTHRPREGPAVLLNRLQQELVASSSSAEWLSISAPTSAGKSYSLLNILEKATTSEAGTHVAYIVPTRALVSQVAADIKRSVAANANVITLPWSEFNPQDRILFVLTQERLHVLLNRSPALRFHSIIVDEAQKVGDSTRGILLQQAIAKSMLRNPALKLLFAMPLADNPETLLEDAPKALTTAVIKRDERTVNQNLLWAIQQPRRSDHWNLALINEDRQTVLGNFTLPAIPAPSSKRLPFVAYALGEKLGGNIIYANTAADAEKMAMQLYDLRGPEAKAVSQVVQELIDLVKQTIHPKYALATVLERAIGFHYGSMPQLIRKTLEDLFRAGEIRYMVCTSTLIEGVNLACKSIFVKGPSKGKGKPMTPADFWNMGGRAGRWGKEFQGNVVCVDPDDAVAWKVPAPRSRSRYVIARTIDAIIKDPKRVLDFINSDPTSNASSQESPITYATSFLASARLEHGSLSAAPWTARYDTATITELDNSLASTLAALGLPEEVIVRNPGVDIFGLYRLKRSFAEREASGEKKATDWLLADPGSSDAVGRYASALARLNRNFGDLFGSDKRRGMLALLMRDWMQGFQLARIIESRLRRYSDLKLANVIRDCMRDVEEYARFRGPKYLKAYSDVLKAHLLESGQTHLLDDIKDYEFQLELGVSQQTQLSLIAIGLSRSTAISLSELIANDALSEEQCREWLRLNQWMVEAIPAAAQREITEIMHSEQREREWKI